MAEITAQAVKALRDQTGAGMMDCKKVLKDADGDLKKAVELLRERGLAKAGKREGRATSEGVVALALEGTVGGILELGCETDFVARTDDFTGLADDLAKLVAGDASVATPDAVLEASLGGEKAGDKITAAISKLGENIQVKRCARLEVAQGVVGGYVHAGGKLGVLVALETGTGGDAVEAAARDVAMHVAAHDPTPVAVDRDGVPADVIESERTIYRKQAEQSGKPEKVIDKIVDGKIAKYVSEICLLQQSFVKDPDNTVGDLLKTIGGDVKVTGFQRYKLGETAES